MGMGMEMGMGTFDSDFLGARDIFLFGYFFKFICVYLTSCRFIGRITGLREDWNSMSFFLINKC